MWRRGISRKFRRAIHDPATVTAMFEDYRAGVGIDSADEEADPTAGQRVPCPLLVLSAGSTVQRSAGLRGGHSIDFGHHMAEESPDEPDVALITLLRVR
jgi:haloacetate dehalogenase